MRKVMVFGSFDPIHEGHRSLFRQARRHGDWLTVVLSRDESIRRIKGREPRTDEDARLELLKREELVDHVVLGHKDDFFKIIEMEMPDVLVLGYDQRTFDEEMIQREIAKRKQRVDIKRAVALNPAKYKSSKR